MKKVLLLGVLLGLATAVGCGGEGDVEIGEVLADNGTGCTLCEECPHAAGECEPGLACEEGFLDTDGESENGCEEAVADSRSDGILTGTADIATLELDGGRSDQRIEIVFLEITADDPDCVPTLDTGCGHTLHHLQFTISDFDAGSTHWAEGTATLSGPLQVSDDGLGAFVQAPISLLFVVSEAGQDQPVVSTGQFTGTIIQDPSTGFRTITFEVTDVQFGGHSMGEIFASASLAD